MVITTALALRTLLQVDALDAGGLAAAVTSAADGVLLDLASAAAYARRTDARRAANHAAEAIAAAGRPVHARISDFRSSATEGDIMSDNAANQPSAPVTPSAIAEILRDVAPMGDLSRLVIDDLSPEEEDSFFDILKNA